MATAVSCLLLIYFVTSWKGVDASQRTDGDYAIKFEHFYNVNSDFKEADYYRYHGRRHTADSLRRVARSDNSPIRPGNATETHTCNQIRGVPTELRSSDMILPSGLDEFYQKYTEAYGIPVVSSDKVSDDALRRICYVLRFLFADHSGIRNSYYKWSGRVAVVGVNEGTTDIPEHSHLDEWWNTRARGLGATQYAPICSAGEENILCYNNGSDRYRNQDIFLHELAHGVHVIGAKFAIDGWDNRLQNAFKSAVDQDLWFNTYSRTDYREYFAEGMQSYFNVNAFADPPNGINNHVDKRYKLEDYDPVLYKLIEEAFPCDNTYIPRCEATREQENQQNLKMNCDKKGNTESTTPSTISTTYTTTTEQTTTEQTTTERTTVQKRDTTTDSGQNVRTTTTEGTTSTQQATVRETTESVSKRTTVGGNVGDTTTVGDTSHGNVNESHAQNKTCVDFHSYCRKWAATGECKKSTTYMLKYCNESCGACREGPGVKTCVDFRVQCRLMARMGYCKNAYSYMSKYCKFSCNFCDDDTGGKCVDKSQYCQHWSSRGHCETFKGYMSNSCRKSCNICQSPGSDNDACADLKDKCAEWAASGECSKSRNYMNIYCRKSCKQCVVGGGSVNDSCVDLDTRCPQWASQFMCYQTNSQMRTKCKKSCNWCDSESGNTCVDLRNSCESWAKGGECSRSKLYMERYCKKSCNKCTD